MAVMASTQSEGIPLEQQKLSGKMSASILSGDPVPSSNGVNGHVSPSEDATKASSDDAPTTKPESGGAEKTDNMPDATDSQVSNRAQNNDAFAANQAVAQDSTPTVADALNSPAKPTEEVAALATRKSPSATAEVPKGEEAQQDELKQSEDTEMLDTAVDTTDSAGKKSDVDAAPGLTAELTEVKEPAVVVTDTNESMEPTKPPVTATSAEPSSSTEAAESTQKMATSDVAAGSSNEDPNLPSVSDLAIQSQEDSAPVAADASMADVPSQASKNAREREEDVSDEPAAKRARTEGPGDEATADADPTTEVSQPAPELMEVDNDHPAQTSDLVSLSLSADPDNLLHPDAEGRPISAYATKEIRRVLASVKKTKAGHNFRDAVSKLWPALADAYNAKVERPMDIASMERKFRNSEYKTFGEFKEDLKLLVKNSATFNGLDHEVTQWAVSAVDNVWLKLSECLAEEPTKPGKKEPKQVPTRHTEPRAAAQPRPKPVPAPATAKPAEKVVQAPIHAVPPPPAAASPPTASGPPTRRDSTKEDDRPKRPIHPPKKDLGYEPKGAKKKKLSPELKFCDDILKDALKPKNNAINWPFLRPVNEERDGAFGYYNQIKDPMDLQKMASKMAAGEYLSAEEFKADFKLIVKNCFEFNPKGTEVHRVGEALIEWFESRWQGFDAFVAKNTARGGPALRRASASSPSAGHKDESEDEGPPSEPEPEVEDAQIVQTEREINALQTKIMEEHQKQMENIKMDSPDPTLMDVSQSIITMLGKRLVDQKRALEELKSKKPAPKAKPAPKTKKAAGGGASGGAAGPSKKAGGGGGKKGGGGGKKNAAARVMGPVEKEAIATGINELDGNDLQKAIDIIKKDTSQEENPEGELELEIEMISNEALNKLYDIMCKALPEFQAEVRKQLAQQQAPPPVEHARPLAGKPPKPKKHKPMGKGEQERKLEELSKLKAKFQHGGRQSSGSQEPPAANETTAAAAAAGDAEDSDVSSEED